jgi:hypothetical protein
MLHLFGRFHDVLLPIALAGKSGSDIGKTPRQLRVRSQLPEIAFGRARPPQTAGVPTTATGYPRHCY